MKNKKSKNISIIIFISLISLLATIFFTYIVQYQSTFKSINEDLNRELDVVCENYVRYLPMKEESDEYNNHIYKSFVQTVSTIIQEDGIDLLNQDELNKICADLGADNLAIIDQNGKLLLNVHPIDVDFSRDRFNQLKNGFKTKEATDGFGVIINGNKNSYYGYPINDDIMAVLMVPSTKTKEVDDAFGWKNLLANANPGTNGFTFAANTHTYEVIWAEDERMIGTSFLDYYSDSYTFYEDISALNIFGEDYLAMIRYSDAADCSFVTCIPKSEVNKLIITPVIFISLFYTLFAGLLTVFCIVKSKETNHNVQNLRLKTIPISVVLIILLFLSTFYVDTLCKLSINMMRNSSSVSNIHQTIDNYKDVQKQITIRSDFCTQRTANIAAYMINKYPGYYSRDGLMKLSEIARCEEIRIYDTDGNTVTSSHGKDMYSLSQDPNDQSYEFRRLLKGVNTYVQEPQINEYGDIRQYAGVALSDINGDNIGLIQVSVIPEQIIDSMQNYSYKSVLDSFSSSNGSIPLAIDKADNTISWCKNSNLIAKNANDYGFTDANTRDEFNGFLNINGVDYLASCKENEDYFLYVMTPLSFVYQSRLSNVLNKMLFMALIILILTIIVPIFASRIPDDEVKEFNKPKRASLKYYINEQWEESSSEKKMVIVIKVVLVTIALAVSLLYLFKDSILDEGSVIKYVFDGNWEKGINAFSFTACFTLSCVTYVGVMFINKLSNYMSKVLSSRGETVSKLIFSFIFLLSIFVCIYFCLLFVGVDASTLLASAGIMSLVVGLGANQLIGDILAGLAIVFDGSIKVGDWIGDQDGGEASGQIKEIGIRSTKLIDGENRVHIVSNSSFGEIINSTVPDYKVKVSLEFDVNTPLNEVVDKLEKEKPNILKKYPEITDGPFVDGIVSLDNKKYEVRFSLYCDGKYNHWLNRCFLEELRHIYFVN